MRQSHEIRRYAKQAKLVFNVRAPATRENQPVAKAVAKSLLIANSADRRLQLAVAYVVRPQRKDARFLGA